MGRPGGGGGFPQGGAEPSGQGVGLPCANASLDIKIIDTIKANVMYFLYIKLPLFTKQLTLETLINCKYINFLNQPNANI